MVTFVQMVIGAARRPLALALIACASSSSPPSCTFSTRSNFSSASDPLVEGVADPLHGPLARFCASFPRALAEPGGAFGARPVVGDDARLRAALAAARDPASRRVLTIVALGGSEVEGTNCPLSRANVSGAPGVLEAGALSCWSQRAKHGHARAVAGAACPCAWPARLARYVIERLEVPPARVVVVNGGIGATGSAYQLLEAHRNFERPREVARGVALGRPLADAADLVLLDFTANDVSPRERGRAAAATEALARYFLRARDGGGGRTRAPPTVALLDVPVQSCAEGSAAAARALHRAHRNLSAAYALPLVDTVVGARATPGGKPAGPNYCGEPYYSTAETRAERARADAFGARANLSAPLRAALERLWDGAAGFGHFNVDYHEWTAAVVFYALIAPAARAGGPAAAAAAAAEVAAATAAKEAEAAEVAERAVPEEAQQKTTSPHSPLHLPARKRCTRPLPAQTSQRHSRSTADASATAAARRRCRCVVAAQISAAWAPPPEYGLRSRSPLPPIAARSASP